MIGGLAMTITTRRVLATLAWIPVQIVLYGIVRLVRSTISLPCGSTN